MNTNPTHIAGELTDTFDTSSQGKGLSLEEISHNYYVSAKMSGSDDASIGGININQSGRNDSTLGNDQEKKAARDFLYMTMLNDLEAMERNLADKYGEDFAENLAAEHLDEETYMRIMAIEDQDERRRQIAIELKQGIDDGSINSGSIENPDFKDWIEVRAAEQDLRVSINLSNSTELEVTPNAGENSHVTQENSTLSMGLSNFLGGG